MFQNKMMLYSQIGAPALGENVTAGNNDNLDDETLRRNREKMFSKRSTPKAAKISTKSPKSAKAKKVR